VIWLWAAALVIGAWWMTRALRTVVILLASIRDRLTAVQNTQTMLFYQVEQIYEMSGIYERFKRARAAVGEGADKAVVDVDDAASTEAWSSLMRRVEARAESALRAQYRDIAGDAKNPDFLMLRSNRRAWLDALPMVRGWPKFPQVCWWGTEEEQPDSVPLIAHRD
jgi:hypothetical protein